ncbi:MAG: hypothetical protein NVSMB13_18490 [Mycobacteriales bacterium]
MPDQKWPDFLWLVRHGESSGNVARDDAEASGAAVIGIPRVGRLGYLARELPGELPSVLAELES